MKNKKTAILIFANSAKKELNSKGIQSSEVFEILNTETLKTVSKTGLPYFHFSEEEQVGNNFGKRFHNAIKSIFKKGFDQVISVGNDTPHLTTKHILKAVTQFNQTDFVLGPSTDGGYYLMGFKKSHFQKLSFLELAWEKRTLQNSFQHQINHIGASVCHLETLSDLDEASDVDLIFQHFEQLSNRIKSILLKIKNVSNFIFESILFSFKLIYPNLYFNKGSPISLHI
ncbi:TIGR04282 family arsenosugar biosynthesis glycosyltransferase [Winogradskyella ursingii]|uniref:TIGR04282 family arsenosugar biosynthesis glycosyltransferase n=1 Tax=Winogradskyella ursingii TaxID=2686079 RepID=UPI0015CDE741|nr:DUF2064 domain-containing protein [Winogradskyella ursingii]